MINQHGSRYSTKLTPSKVPADDPSSTQANERDEQLEYVEERLTENERQVIDMAHRTHAHPDIHLLLLAPQQYQWAITQGATPAEAAQQEVDFVVQRASHNIVPALIRAQRAKALTKSQMMQANCQIPYKNGMNAKCDVPPHAVEEVLKIGVPFLAQHAHLVLIANAEERRKREVEVEEAERKRGVWTEWTR